MSTPATTAPCAPVHGGYRPEIDGLRALAVAAVILFHAGFEAFSGGFVGVDVFFVISGYLITSIVIAEECAGTFSMARFFERRARRILPALLSMMLLAAPLAWWWMNPLQLESFARSVLAVLAFGSNILFWRTTGYFDGASEESPLLHTWSLAIEEQYYLLFPAALLFVFRFGRGRAVCAVLAVGVAALALGEHLLASGQARASFYLAPFRAWELLAGSLVALIAPHELARARRNPVLNDALSLLGMALILCALFSYDETTPFPGLHAAPPTLGAALVLAFAHRDTWLARALSLRWLVGLGLISYSAYLWHQPLFAFARIYSSEPPPAATLLILAATALVLAYVSWRWVEQPFRDAQLITRRQLAMSAAIASLALGSLAIAAYATDGARRLYEARLDAPRLHAFHELERAVASRGYGSAFDDGECKFIATRISSAFRERYDRCAARYARGVMIIGDSHALDLFNALAQASTRAFVVGVARAGCRPQEQRTDCHYDDVESFLRDRAGTVATVFFTQSGAYLADRAAPARLDPTAVRTVRTYLKRLAQYTAIVWVGPQAELAYDMASANPLIDKVAPRIKPESEVLDRQLHSVDMQPVHYVSKIAAVKLTPADLSIDGAFTYSDRDHWSTFGERTFGARLLKDPTIAAALLAPMSGE